MTDIFLSYAREDLSRAKPLAAALENQGWSVFWDTTLLAGQYFEEVIEQEIEQALCMIVAWSAASKRSDWVLGEANIARERKILVPILFEDVKPPIAFRALHTENFTAWNGDAQSEAFKKLQRAVARLAGSGTVSDQTSTAGTNKPALASATNQVASDSKTPDVSNKTFIEPELVVIPAGSFRMASDLDPSEQPIHAVNINKPFSIAKYLVTFDEYELFAKAKNQELPSDEGWGRGKRPVIGVSWENATAYASWLSDVSGKSYRLPSEAEWEYAARAGTESIYYWGDSEREADRFAWFSENSENKTHSVGEKLPNALGLYDTAGNTWEWIQDCWHANYQNAPADGSAWQAQNKGDCPRRVLRGGSWRSLPAWLRSALRGWYNPYDRGSDVGFRLAQD